MYNKHNYQPGEPPITHSPELANGCNQRGSRVRRILISDKIPADSIQPRMFPEGAVIISDRQLTVNSRFHPLQSFNQGSLKNLQSTKKVYFSLPDTQTRIFHELPIPEWLSERIGEYLRERQFIDSNEGYRLPEGLPNTPVNCMSFVYYIKRWFEEDIGLSYEYIRTANDEATIQPGDTLYYSSGDEGVRDDWHYMIYIGEGVCISKNGGEGLVITRHKLRGLYRVVAKSLRK